MRTKTLYRRDGARISISRFPNFHKSGSITGMKSLYYGKNALLIRCGSLDLQCIRRTRNLL